MPMSQIAPAACANRSRCVPVSPLNRPRNPLPRALASAMQSTHPRRTILLKRLTMELESKGPGVATLRRYAAVLVSGLLLAAPVAQAQNYEGYYGNTEWRDVGEDVKTVKYCPGNGSIAVGTRRNSDADQVLVTRVSDTGVTDNAGLNTWQQAYYVGGGKHSAGYGIIELAGGAGFAVTGSLRTDEGSYAFVMRLDCKGNPQWTTLLDNRDQTSRATGYDLIQSG